MPFSLATPPLSSAPVPSICSLHYLRPLFPFLPTQDICRKCPATANFTVSSKKKRARFLKTEADEGTTFIGTENEIAGRRIRRAPVGRLFGHPAVSLCAHRQHMIVSGVLFLSRVFRGFRNADVLGVTEVARGFTIFGVFAVLTHCRFRGVSIPPQ